MLPIGKNAFARRTAMCLAAVILAAAIRPDRVFDWFLENVTVAVCLGLLVFSYRRLSLSDTSYAMLFAFFCLHEWGAHYKYYDDPIGEWLKGPLHTQRNDFDRIVHFGFGLLVAYPLQEWCMRTLKVRSWWRYVIPVTVILGMSAVYEMVEALAAAVLSPERGEEFVGMQGDIWDSQKDMAVAWLGSVVAMFSVASLRLRRARPVMALSLEVSECEEQIVH